MEKPQVGSIVHYIQDGKHCAAIVTEVHDPKLKFDSNEFNTIVWYDVTLCVFPLVDFVENSSDQGYWPFTLSFYSENNDEGSWHWPEKIMTLTSKQE